MYEYLREGFNQAFHGMEDEYKAIINAYQKTIKDLGQYVPEIAAAKAKEEEAKARLKIKSLKQKYWDKATKYLDDEAAKYLGDDAAKQEAKEQNSSRSGKLKDLIISQMDLMKDQMEMHLLDKELPFMDDSAIEKKYENSSEAIRRLIMVHLQAGDNNDNRHLLNSLRKTELDVINELRGRIKQQQAYSGSGLIQTDAIWSHNIDHDLETINNANPYFST